MENASKALLIVAGVMLGIMLLSVMIYVFRQGARVQETYDQKQITNQLELYNSRFEKFDKDNNNIIDIISLANLAFDVNKDTNYDPTLAVRIEIAVGGKTFVLPNTNQITERNTILSDTGSTMSIYDLAYLPLKGVSGEENLGIYPSTIQDCGSKGKDDDKLTTTKLVDGRTIYKFLFKVEDPTDFEYHPENLKVSRVKVTAYCNPLWDASW